MSGKITIENDAASKTVIDVEGVIGVPEKWQFDDPAGRVATYETFRGVVESLQKIEARDILVNIRSTGGNVNDALLIYDALLSTGARITTRCYGYVASAATIIAQAASPGFREISANSLYLIHKSACSAEGNSQELMQTLDMLGKTDQRIAAVYADRSGKSASEFARLMGENNGNGRWLSPEEVVDCALADTIIPASPIQANAAEMLADLGLPPIPNPRNKMIENISKKWNAMLDALGISTKNIDTPQKPVEDEKPEGAIIAELQLPEAHATEAEDMKNQISILEAIGARLAATPTATKPKEDPSPQDVRLSPNQEAYMEDVRKFI